MVMLKKIKSNKSKTLMSHYRNVHNIKGTSQRTKRLLNVIFETFEEVVFDEISKKIGLISLIILNF